MLTRTIFLFLLLIISYPQAMLAQWLVEKESPYSVEETTARLEKVLGEKGLKVFSQIDHGEAARQANLPVGEMRLLIFGNPMVGSKLMQADPRVGLELPLKMLVFERAGKTWLCYREPKELARHYELKEQKAVLEKVSKAMDSIATAAVQ